ncbi:MAG: hypothetical protein WCG26_12280 [Chloroflexales bacterium]
MQLPPTFYLALGSRPCHHDVDVALAVGQTTFLVPGCAPVARLLADHPDPRISVALDSHVFDGPARPTLEAYADVVAAWHNHPGRFAFAISYDHLGQTARSLHDHDRLCRRLERLGVVSTDAPVVPVVQRGGSITAALGPDVDDDDWDDVPLDERTLPRHPTPVVALGGIAFARYSPAAMSWLVAQLIALSRRAGSGGAHLLGVSRPDVVRREGCVSFDSSRPPRMAACGWTAIAASYQPRYGFSPALLQTQRAARLAYWIIDSRDRLGLPWTAACDLETTTSYLADSAR